MKMRRKGVEPLEARIAPAFAAVIDLSLLSGPDGFRVDGDAANDELGKSVSFAGDVNGDGIDDIIIGADRAAPISTATGAAYVVFGQAGGFLSSLEVSNLDGTNGFRISGAAGDDQAGFSVSGAGDVNGDGVDDLLVGAFGADGANTDSGAAYVIFGRTSAQPADISVASLTGSNGFKINGVFSGNSAGNSVSAAGDVNGDGVDDVLIGAYSSGVNGADSGAAYVVFGKTTAFLSSIQLSSLNGNDGFRIAGAAAFDRAGGSVSAAGDVNGDGVDDVVIGAFGASGGASVGAAYVVYGRTSGIPATVQLSALNGTNGFTLSGALGGDLTGISVSGAGDVNGDGIDDLVVGAPGADPNGADSGAAYVIFGKSTGMPANFNLTSLNGTNGFLLKGGFSLEGAGISVSGAGDVNGDGLADVLIGAPGVPVNTGASYVLFGNSTGFASSIELSGLNGTNGFTLRGRIGENAGFSLRAAGDVNGDMVDDLIVGAFSSSINGTNAGSAYVVFGVRDATPLALTSLAGFDGFRIIGGGPNDALGGDVHSAGDVNGDGFEDVIVGARYAAPNGTGSGAAYVVFGKSSGFASNLRVSDLNGTNGFRINGPSPGSYVGGAVSGAGDVNGDGFADLMIGVPFSDLDGPNAGTTYVVFGKANGFASAMELTNLNGTNGFRIRGERGGDLSGYSVSALGDIDGDNFDDILIGARGAGDNEVYSGSGYVVFGSGSGFGSVLSLSNLDGTNGFQILGLATGERAGHSVSGAGDVNGDGLNDLIIGAPYSDENGSNAGLAYVVFGSVGGFNSTLALSSLDGSNGFQLLGEVSEDLSGFSVSGAGDVNLDGFDDVIVGAFRNDPNGDSSGAAYVVFGRGFGFPAVVELATLNGADGFTLHGNALGDFAGKSVSGVGDFNGDGFEDILIGADGTASSGNNNSGASYLVFGRSAFQSVIELSNLNGFTGFPIFGASGDFSGASVSGAGDVNGDGFSDLIVGAPTDIGSNAPGSAYLVLGRGPAVVSISDAAIIESDSGIREMIFTVSLSSFSPETVSVKYSLAGGTATAGVDFSAFSPTVLTFDPGQTSKTISVSILPDNLTELDETFFIQLSDATNATASSTLGQGLIVNDDRFSSVIELRGLLGPNGFQINGEAQDALTGRSLSSAGDINGDGFDDLLIGATEFPGVASFGLGGSPSDLGAAYIVYGKPGAFADTLELSTLDGTNGFQINGEPGVDTYSISVRGAGDVNGDGFDDIIVGALFAGAKYNGIAYVVFGTDSGFGSALDLSSLNGVTGFRVVGASDYDFLGASVSGAGDLNGDGFDDVIIGAPGANANANDSGAGYVIFGKGTEFLSSLNAGSLQDTDGFRIDGEAAGNSVGNFVAPGGDINGDGFDDAIIGSVTMDPGSPVRGGVYVVFGKGATFGTVLELSALNGSNGFQMNGQAASGAGDLNGDGFDDVLIGSETSGPNGANSGSAFLVFGKAQGFSSVLQLTALNGLDGFRMNGEVAGDIAGATVSSAGDFNGDGVDDLLIGAFRADPNGITSGATYLIFGTRDGFQPVLEFSALNGNNGFQINGEAGNDHSGRVVSSAGDLNGDGFSDLLIAATRTAENGPNTGGAYVVFGRSGGLVSISDGAVTEGNTGTRQINFTVTLDQASTDPVTLTYATAPGTASGADFTSVGPTLLTFDPGQTSKMISITIFGDTALEGNETFSILLSNITGAFLQDTVAIGTITNDDLLKPAFAPEVNLLQLSGVDGFRLVNGGAAESAESVSSAGDVNGDGLDDFIIGSSYSANVPGGAAYVVFGRSTGFGQGLDLATLDGTNGFQIRGGAQGGRLGYAVSGAGDLNGDGFDDVVVGSSGNVSYVVFGKASGFTARLEVSSLNGTNGFAIPSESLGDYAGSSVSNAGDINADGFDDLLIGASTASANGFRSGAAYVVFGTNSFASVLQLSNLNGTNGFQINGEGIEDYAGVSVSEAGDVNGDGFADVLIGAHRAEVSGTGSGASYVVFGKGTAFNSVVELSSLNGANGFKLQGDTMYDATGRSVSSIGDFNGDGIDDLLIGAYYAAPNGPQSGAAYVVFGKSTGFAGLVNLPSLNGADGFRINGENTGIGLGFRTAPAGDVNGDGFADLLVGGSTGNMSYLVFGNPGITTPTFELSALNGTNGFQINGGVRSLAGAGDINNDGFDDFLVGGFTGTFALLGRSNVGATISDVVMQEGNSGTTTFTFTVSLTNAPTSPVTVTYATSAGSATAGADFVAITPTVLTFDPGQSSRTISVTVLTDSVTEFDETFSVTLTSATNAIIIDGQASGTIANDDAFAPQMEISALAGPNGFMINGVASDDATGISVSILGDINGDGIDDIMVGTNRLYNEGISSPVAYVVFGKTSGFGPAFDLTSLDGTNGFQIGHQFLRDIGEEVSAAGDFNGDNIDDILIGSPEAIGNGFAFVVFGKTTAFPAVLNLCNLQGASGFQINGETANDGVGRSLSSAGDVNGDGFDDIIIGAYNASPNGVGSGAAYVVFGKSSGFALVPLALLDGTNGFQINGEAASDAAGTSVSSAGDFNNDGFDDLLIGAPSAAPNGIGSGASYVIFGKGSAFASTMELSNLDGSNGFQINGELPSDFFGSALANADVNGDGASDLIIGADHGDGNGTNSGVTYVIFGRTGTFASTLDVSSLTGSNGFAINGEIAGDFSGSSVSSAGDVNGDGFEDILIGAFNAGANGASSGLSYVVFGKANGFGPELQLSSLDGQNGFQINGASGYDNFGDAVSGGGDINGDGFDDLLIGAPFVGENFVIPGAAYVIFGRSSEIPVPPIGVSISDASVTEGNSGTANLVFTITLSGPSAGAVSVTVSTIDDLATVGVDFAALPPTTIVTFAPGETTKTVTIPVIGDDLPEQNETFFVNLSNAVGVAIVDGTAVGTINNDDVIVKPTTISFKDVDGDQVTISLSGGVKILPTDITYNPDGTVAMVDLTRFAIDGETPASRPVNITISVKTPKGSGGDGLADIGLIDATGVDLGTVKVIGNVDQLLAGDDNALRPAIRSLTIFGSLGPEVAGDVALHSDFFGDVRSLTIRGSVRNSSIEITGDAGTIRIDGNLDGEGGMSMSAVQAFAATGEVPRVGGGLPFGAVMASSVKNFSVKGNVTGASVTATTGGVGNVSVRGNMTNSSLVSAGVVRVVKIFGELVSDDADAPTIITAVATLNPKSSSRAAGINALTVRGDVENARILVGFNDMREGVNPDASVGRVTVNGNWIASSLSAGILDGGGDGFGQNDINIDEPVVDKILARIASIVIKGTATGSVAAGDHFGIVAELIGAARINNVKVPLVKNVADNILIGADFGSTTNDFRLVEISRPA